MVTKIKTEVHALYAAAAVEGRDDGCRGNALDALRELCNFIAGPETQSPTARLREKEHAAAVRRAPAVSAQVGRPGDCCLPTSPHMHRNHAILGICVLLHMSRIAWLG